MLIFNIKLRTFKCTKITYLQYSNRQIDINKMEEIVKNFEIIFVLNIY